MNDEFYRVTTINIVCQLQVRYSTACLNVSPNVLCHPSKPLFLAPLTSPDNGYRGTAVLDHHNGQKHQVKP